MCVLFVMHCVMLRVLVCFLCFVCVGVCGLKAPMYFGRGSLGDVVWCVFVLCVCVGVCLCVLFSYIYIQMNVWAYLRCVV